MIFAAYIAPLPASVSHVFKADSQEDADAGASVNGMIAVEVVSFISWRDYYFDSEEILTVRPTPASPPTLSASVTETWSGLPPGATIRVIDPETQVEAGSDVVSIDGEIDLNLIEGEWTLIVEETFPWKRAEFNIEVIA